MTAFVKFIRRLFRLEVDEIQEDEENFEFPGDVDPATGFPAESDM